LSEITRTLEMTFSTELDKDHVIRVYDARDDITGGEITTVMDDIISKNIFYGTGGEITGKMGAKLITKEVSSFDIL